jgi:galactitol-specific phosphotransferase system IIB component
VIKKFLPFLLIFIACSGAQNSSTISEEEIQRRIDEAVEQALNEAASTTSTTLTASTSTTLSPTTSSTTTTTTSSTTTTTTIPMNVYTANFETTNSTGTYDRGGYGSLGNVIFINPISEQDDVPVDFLTTKLELLVDKSGSFAVWENASVKSGELMYLWKGNLAKAYSSETASVEVILTFTFDHFIRYSSDKLQITPSANSQLKIEPFTTNNYNFDIYTTNIIGNYSITVDDESFTGDFMSTYDVRGSGTDLFTDISTDFTELINFQFSGNGGNNEKGWTTLIDQEFGGVRILIKPYRVYFNPSRDDIKITLQN